MIPLIDWIYLYDNLKNWDFDIGGYHLTAKDAQIVMEALVEKIERSKDNDTGTDHKAVLRDRT